MELAFAAVYKLCAPMRDHLERLPGPQREAHRTAFGISDGPAPDRFLIGRDGVRTRNDDLAATPELVNTDR
jgi:hypothetical protein